MIGPLTEMAIGGLTGGMTDIPVDMLTGVFITIVVVVLIASEGVLSVSFARDTPARTVFDIDASIGRGFDMMVDVSADALERTGDGVASGIGVPADVNAKMCVSVIPALDLMTLPASLEDSWVS